VRRSLGAAALASGLMALILGAAALGWLPSPDQSRELALWQALPQPPQSQAVRPYRAADFCVDWTGQAASEVDCRSGYLLGSLTRARQPDIDPVWHRVREAVAGRIEAASDLTQHLQQRFVTHPNPALGQILFHFKAKTDRWRDRWSRLAELKAHEIDASRYAEVFSLLLDMHGQTYEPVGNRFKSINWHPARAMDQSSVLLVRGQTLEQNLKWAPWVITGCCAILLMLAWVGWRWRGWLLMAAMSTIACLSLLIVADASVRFGEGSAVFAFNPLGNQMERQSYILLGVMGLLLVLQGLAPWLSTLARLCSQRVGLLMMALIAAMLAAYGLLGPAGGSELLKVSMALAAGLLTAMQGRSVHLTAELAPGALKPWHLLGQLGRRPPATGLAQPLDLIGQQLGRPILQMAVFTMSGLALAALVFNDFGASLVTACMAISALFFVFGARITLAVSALMALAAWLASQTSKVQARLSLMVDPLTASISDFARLAAFEQATAAMTAGFGKIAWCNGVGACIPLQSLSDYMPVVLAGALGRYGTLMYFLMFVTALILLAAWLVRRSLTQTDLGTRTVTLTAFYLLLGTLVQTLVTFLGNWRVIPLTGLGTPLVSIGLSSFLAPALAVGLIIALGRIEQRGDGR